MKKVIILLSILLISFTAQANFYENLGYSGEFPQYNEKEEILQLILLDSADKAFATTNILNITLDTSLTEIKKYYPIGSGFMEILLNEAAIGVQAHGCSLSIEKNMAQKIWWKIKSRSNRNGTISRVSDLLPILNNNINCL